MKGVSLASGIAIIVVANIFALIQAARNRMGSSDADVTLTNRELSFYRRTQANDDSGVTLYLHWTIPSENPSAYGNTEPRWLDPRKLETLGFDCSVRPGGDDAARFYQRQRRRQAFIALEYNGAAWRAWLDAFNRASEERTRLGVGEPGTGNASRLVAIDADLSGQALRARHPQRSSVIIVPAIVSIGLNPFPYAGMKRDPKHPVRIEGRIEQVASAIHVPRPLSDGFQRGNVRNENGGESAYSVHLRYGTLFEPWVSGVRFDK